MRVCGVVGPPLPFTLLPLAEAATGWIGVFDSGTIVFRFDGEARTSLVEPQAAANEEE